MLQNALPLESDLPAERSALPARAILGLDRAEIAWRALEERFVVSPLSAFRLGEGLCAVACGCRFGHRARAIESRGATVAAMAAADRPALRSHPSPKCHRPRSATPTC
jgi:hypothetical protein